MAPRRCWAKANNPYWSTHVATWLRGHQTAQEYCRRRKLLIATFEQWARHLLSPEDLRNHAKDLQKLRREAMERQGKNGQPKRRRRPPRYRYSVRTDSGPVALRAFWSMHVEALNWSGMGLAEYAAALGRHGIATSMLFRWRVEFGLTARKAPQLATVMLADGATNEVPALAALRDLVRPPDGRTTIELDDGRPVFASAGSSPAAVQRQLANREKAS
jgi:hypothetical protein